MDNATTHQPPTIEIPVAEATLAQKDCIRLSHTGGGWVAVVTNPEYVGPVVEGFQGAVVEW